MTSMLRRCSTGFCKRALKFVNGFVALILLRLILGPTRFADSTASAHFESFRSASNLSE